MFNFLKDRQIHKRRERRVAAGSRAGGNRSMRCRWQWGFLDMCVDFKERYRAVKVPVPVPVCRFSVFNIPALVQPRCYFFRPFSSIGVNSAMDEVVYMPPHTNPAPFGAFGWGAFRRRPPPPPLAEPLCDNAWLVIGRPERRLPPAPPLAAPARPAHAARWRAKGPRLHERHAPAAAAGPGDTREKT